MKPAAHASPSYKEGGKREVRVREVRVAVREVVTCENAMVREEREAIVWLLGLHGRVKL